MPKAGPGLLAIEDKDGIVLRLANPLNSGGNGGELQAYQIVALPNNGVRNYVTAQLVTTSGTLQGSAVSVGKCFTAQMIESELIDGNEIGYLYGSSDTPQNFFDNIRYAAGTATGNEWQVLHPRYSIGQLIFVQRFPGVFITRSDGMSGNVEPVLDADNSPIYLMEVSSPRFWVRQYSQSGTLP